MLHVRVLSLTKYVRDVMSGDDFLGRKEITCNPVNIMFSFINVIQLFQKSGRFSPIANAYLNNYWIIISYGLLTQDCLS